MNKLLPLTLLCALGGAQTTKPKPSTWPNAPCVSTNTCGVMAGPNPAEKQEKPPAPPVDVPPISETYWMESSVICMDTCPEPRISLTPRGDGSWMMHTHLTCADKTRFLMTAEDGSKHCIRLKEVSDANQQ